MALGFGHVVPRYDCIVFPFVAAGVFWFLAETKGKALQGALMGISASLALGVLAHLWTTGHEGRAAILLGIAPYSDAGAFYSDAERMIYGLRFAESSRRPLYVAVLGAVLRWSGDDLRIALFLSTVACGLGMGFVAWEAARAQGRTAGALVFVIAYFWVRRFTGFVGTEALAFPLGALGFGLLLRVSDANALGAQWSPLSFGAALFAIVLALITRPGPLLVIPALLLWALFSFPRRSRVAALGAGLLAVLAAACATRLVTSRLSNGATFNDYPNILYALIHRGDLYLAMNEHPELSELAVSARGRAIFSILFSDVMRDPALLVAGPLEALLSFIVGPHGLFSFVWTNPDDHVLEDGALVQQLVSEYGYMGPALHWIRVLGVFSFVNALVTGLLGAGFIAALSVAVVRLVRERWQPKASLLLTVIAAVLASAMFAPTWIGEGLQMQTAVFAFVPATASLAFSGGFHPYAEGQSPPATRWLTAVALAVPAALGLAIAATCAWPLPSDRGDCSHGMLQAKLNPSTREVLRPATESTPNERSLESNLSFLKRHNETLVESVRAVAQVGDVMDVVYDACSERTRIVFGQAGVLPPIRTWARLRVAPQVEPIVGRVSAP